MIKLYSAILLKMNADSDIKTFGSKLRSSKEEQAHKKGLCASLESSRIRLSQIEQDLQQSQTQGMLFGRSSGFGSFQIATIFDMEHARWLDDDDNRHMAELRTGLQAHLSDSDLRIIVDGHIAHYDEIFHVKGVATKSDVFHLITGMWTNSS